MADDPRVRLTGAAFGALGRALLLGHPPWCQCADCAEVDGLGGVLAHKLSMAARLGSDPAPPPPPPPPELPKKAPRRKRVRVEQGVKALPAGGASARAGRPSSPAGGDAPEVEVEVIPPGAPVRRRR